MDLRVGSSDNAFSLPLAGGDLATDSGLHAAVFVSLFTDRRASADDAIPDGTDNRRGWWADGWPEIPGDLVGSRLWLLAREKQLPDVLQRARTYAEEALAWLVEDGVAATVAVTAEWAAAGILGLHVVITMADGSRWADVIQYPLEG